MKITFCDTEGAHLTNIIFMNENSKILDICNTHNSWQKMFELQIN